jgi:1-pyrroline-5-carboxylate dehydrogenase
MNGEAFVSYPDTQVSEIDHFVTSLNACPKSGLHNPFKNPERCGGSRLALLLVPVCYHVSCY